MSLTPEAIQTLVTGEHGDPFAVLGPHASRDGSVTVRAFLPGAAEVAVVAEGGAFLAHPLKPIHPDGLWEGEIAGRLAAQAGASGSAISLTRNARANVAPAPRPQRNDPRRTATTPTQT
mgnify:CR=1 FL=1